MDFWGFWKAFIYFLAKSLSEEGGLDGRMLTHRDIVSALPLGFTSCLICIFSFLAFERIKGEGWNITFAL